MIDERALVLLACAAAGGLLLLLFRVYRARSGSVPERLEVDELGLELMTGCCAFVVFTSPSCRPCKAAVSVVSQAAEKRPGLTEVTTVDAVERPELAVRYDVRTVPTVFLITASGHVVRRWKEVPPSTDVDGALNAI